MTQDEIIEMARQAGLSVENPQYGYTERHHVAGWITDLEAFAKLVAAKEREIQGAAFEKILESIRRSERAEEREACAKVCEDKNTLLAWPTYAAAIRARGEQA